MGLCDAESSFREVSPMVHTVPQFELGILGGKQVIGDFEGGDIASDGGAILLAEADRKLGLTAKLAACLRDDRESAKVQHAVGEMIAQRVYQIACGYEDCNDADDLRRDPVLKTAVGRLPKSAPDLASQPTLSRLENSVGAGELYRMSEALIDLFIAGRDAPKSVVLDIDATDDPTHGQQQFTAFQAHYDCHCYLPLIVTAQVDGGPDELLATVLRAGNASAGRGAVAVIKRIVERLRVAWPEVRIVLRADGGFAKPEVYDWCEAADVRYLIGLPINSRLREFAAPHLDAARVEHEATGEKVRRLHEVNYAAGSWPHLRRVLIKAEVTDQGDNPRFVVTDLRGGPLALYDFYSGRGEPENRIKELKCDLAIDRTSCHRFLANQFRLLLHAAAFVLLSFIRRCLAGTELAAAQVCTLRRKLLKLGVRVRETARRVWLQFASSCPVRWLWPRVLARIRA
jgi:hypothetical protein